MVSYKYSTNVRNCIDVEGFFAELGYAVKYFPRKPAAIGMGQEVVEFKIPRFKPSNLTGKLLERWQELPIEVVG